MSYHLGVATIVPAGFALVPKKVSPEMAVAWADASPGALIEGKPDDEANAICAQCDWDAMVAIGERQAANMLVMRRDLRPELSRLFQAAEYNFETGEGVDELRAAIDAAQIALARDASAAAQHDTLEKNETAEKQALEDEVIALLKGNQLMAAIRLHRDKTGLSLHESKSIVEQMQRKLRA